MPMLRGRGPRPLRGRIAVPGDKSISHRAVLLAAIARGASTITGLNDGDDVARTVAAVRLLGARVDIDAGDGTRVEVEGYGWDGLTEPADTIAAGNSGSTARMGAGLCAAVTGLSVISGDVSLRRRPMLRVVAPLRAMGASIEGRDHGDHLPLSIRGAPLTGMDHDLSVASAQVKTALLLAGMSATGSTSVTEPLRSRDHTELMLAAAGVDVRVDNTTVTVGGGQEPLPREWTVPGDVSSALFLVVAACLVPGSELTIAKVGLNPTRSAALDVLATMGADISIEPHDPVSGEAIGDVTVRYAPLQATTVPAQKVPSLIDEIPILAVAAAHAEGETTFHGVGELRAKESDRVATIVEGLTGLGGEADAGGDTLVVRGPVTLDGGRIRSHGDHRIAMAFAVAGLMSRAPVKVEGWSSVETSFPTFLEVLGTAQGTGR
jgi:3-phosphoshikimate 1-carboxyvinyltransferase